MAGAWRMEDDGSFELAEPYKEALARVRGSAQDAWRRALLDHLERESPYSRDELGLAMSRGELVISRESAAMASVSWRAALVEALAEESGLPYLEVAAELDARVAQVGVRDWDALVDGVAIEVLERGGRCSR